MYANVDVIVEGALDSYLVFDSQHALDEYIELSINDAKANALHMEIYVQWHDHEMTHEECACAQYEMNHHPYATYCPKEKCQ